MSNKTQMVFGEALPRWATLLLLSYCAWTARRLVNELDATISNVRLNTTAIAVHTEQIAQQTKAFGQMEQILRLFEGRLIRQEERKGNERTH